MQKEWRVRGNVCVYFMCRKIHRRGMACHAHRDRDRDRDRDSDRDKHTGAISTKHENV